MRVDRLEITNDHMIFITITTLLAIAFVRRRFWQRNGLQELTFRQNPNKNDAAFCAVCLDEITEGDKFRRLPECKHCFHVECIDVWFQSRSTCPLCRNDVGFVCGGRGSNEQQEEVGVLLYYLIRCSKIIVTMIDKVPPLNFDSSFYLGQTSTYFF
ncbi:hypothetical protein Q3G72_000345 [Acer saccharum]|nr:hypothetical protein Q3G72_000345 [Acer saccharum]